MMATFSIGMQTHYYNLASGLQLLCLRLDKFLIFVKN